MSKFSVLCPSLLVVLSSVLAVTQISDDEAIHKLPARLVGAWNRGDAKGMAAVYAPDGDLVIPTGEMQKGQKKIEQFYADVFSRGYKGSQASADIRHLRFVGRSVAIVDGTWSISGAHDASGKEMPTERGIYNAIAVKQEGEWRLSAVREQTSATEVKTQ